MTEFLSPSSKRRTHTSKALALSLAVCVGLISLAATAFADHKPNQQAPLNVAHRHFLKMYKVEKVFDIEDGEYVHGGAPDQKTHVFCDSNGVGTADDDIATDGMWKIVDADQDELGKRPWKDIKVYASYGDSVDRTKWHFEVENRTDGRAQLKFYATCLGYYTEPNSHQHNWLVDSQVLKTVTGTAVAQPAPPAPTTNERVVDETDLGSCPSGSIAIAPGFQWTTGYGDLYKSRYRSNAFNAWHWGFWVEPGNYTVELSHRCLYINSDNSSYGYTHYHQLQYDFHPSSGIAMTPDTGIGGGPQYRETRTRSCDSHEKGMVHSFDIDSDAMGQHLWFLGMTPKIKSRAYHILNEDAATHNAKFGLMCFNDRTGKRKKP